jgi:6-phosphogluconate dehydrogenase
MEGSDATRSEIGVIGLDVIGRNVACRLAEHPFKVAAYDWQQPRALALREQTSGQNVRVAASGSELMASLGQPRTILVFSGQEAPLHSVVDQLLPELEPGDLLMDAGDSYFRDTVRHERQLAERDIQFMGLGLAGGEEAARHGSIVMAGGEREARNRTRPLIEALAATVDGEPCVSHCETAAAAHYAKMVHAGVEEALSQLLSETFDLLERALPLSYWKWDEIAGQAQLGALNGYLMEISGRVYEPTGIPTLRLPADKPLDPAKNDLPARRLAQSGWELGAVIPTLETVAGTERGARTGWRHELVGTPFRHPTGPLKSDPASVLHELHGAFDAAMMITYAQGMALLAAASQHHGFGFNLLEISRAWRGGARLRASLLDDIATALKGTADLPGLLSDDDLSERVMGCQESLRQAVWRANELDAAVPALLASLDYLDFNRAAWLPVNVIRRQRSEPGRTGVFVS